MKKNIITGQQIGLLGGPLYTTYKVLGALKLADQIEGDAIYWLETNDADFNEINRIVYLNKENDLKTLKWDVNTNGYSCGYIEIDKKLIEIFNVFFSTIHQTEYTEELKDIVFDCYQEGTRLGEASKKLAERLFHKYNLEIFDPKEKKFREFSKKILLTEAKRTNDGEQCNCFCLDNYKRMAIFKKNNNFYLRNGEKININSYDLVPNVKTRNLCQDAYFNTHSYIAGPGEIKYIKELDKYYTNHNIKKSNIVPRMSITLIEKRIKRVLKKTALTLEDIENKTKDLALKEALIAFSGFDKKKVSEKINKSIDTMIKSFESEGIETGNLKKMIYSESKKLLGEKRKKIKIDFDSKKNNIELIYNSLKPMEHKQERTFNIFYYMNLYGGLNFINFLYNNYNSKNKVLEVSND